MRIHKVKVCETKLLSGKAYCVGTSLSGLGLYEVLSVILTAAPSGAVVILPVFQRRRLRLQGLRLALGEKSKQADSRASP